MNTMNRPVNMERFKKFVLDAYLFRAESFQWATVPDAVHNAYAHTIIFNLGLVPFFSLVTYCATHPD